MNRRTILTGAAAAATGLTLPRRQAQAQQATRIHRIGVLLNRKSPSPETESLRTGLTQLGYIEGTNTVYQVRPAEGQLDRLPGFAVELVSMGVDVIVSYGGPDKCGSKSDDDDPDRVYPRRRSCRHWRRGYT